MESQCDISDSQYVCAVEHAEEEFFDQFGILNSQLLSDMTVLESQRVSRLPLGHYQGPGKPMPTLRNEAVVLPLSGPDVWEQNFDLGFCFDDSNHESDSTVQLKVPQPIEVCTSLPEKKSMPSKPLKPKQSFKDPRSEDEMKLMSHKKFAQETHKKIQWVVNMYHSWHVARNRNPDMVPISVDLDRPETITKQGLSYALCHFITKIKKINGEEYPPKTIYEMVICIQMFLETHGLFWKILDDKDEEFIKLRYTYDNLIKEHAKSGMGSYVKQAQVLSYSDEKFLWQNGFLGTSNPEQLVKTVLFILGLHCALRAGAEHHSLSSIGFRSQLKYFFPDGGEQYILYTEDLGTKTNSGGLKHKKISQKQVTIFPDTEHRECCPVYLIYKYHSLLPLNRKCEALYLRP